MGLVKKLPLKKEGENEFVPKLADETSSIIFDIFL